MPENSTTGNLGDLSLPLNPADFNTTLTPLEPARARLLQLFQTAITHELSEVWQKLQATLPEKHALLGKPPIADTLELAPSAWVMQQRKADFPLLCLFRFGAATWSEHTLEIDKREQNWRLVYVLPALDVADMHRFSDVTNAVTATVRRVIRERGHKAFEDGALQFFHGTGGLGVFRIASEEVGPAQFAEGDDAPVYYAVTLTLASTEYATDNPDEFPEIEGIDFSIGVGDSTGVIADLISASTDPEVELL